MSVNPFIFLRKNQFEKRLLPLEGYSDDFLKMKIRELREKKPFSGFLTKFFEEELKKYEDLLSRREEIAKIHENWSKDENPYENLIKYQNEINIICNKKSNEKSLSPLSKQYLNEKQNQILDKNQNAKIEFLYKQTWNKYENLRKNIKGETKKEQNPLIVPQGVSAIKTSTVINKSNPEKSVIKPKKEFIIKNNPLFKSDSQKPTKHITYDNRNKINLRKKFRNNFNEIQETLNKLPVELKFKLFNLRENQFKKIKNP